MLLNNIVLGSCKQTAVNNITTILLIFKQSPKTNSVSRRLRNKKKRIGYNFKDLNFHNNFVLYSLRRQNVSIFLFHWWNVCPRKSSPYLYK